MTNLDNDQNAAGIFNAPHVLSTNSHSVEMPNLDNAHHAAGTFDTHIVITDTRRGGTISVSR